ncbi:MAG: hypothetical protein DHS20C01_29440 [marine bacterium B5-7]|nr:MAG: hypothetical protein DHS20C01_29440 [marine bacterium B5-7]
MHVSTLLPAKLFALTVTAGISSGCVLDTEGRLGGCPDGKLVCTLSDKSYSFNSESHGYSFVGRCEIKRDDGGSEFGDPIVRFKVKGEYEPGTLEFAEAAKFEGRLNSSASVIGTSTKDPWIYPDWPVAIKNYAGDPNGLANAFCIDGIPPEYSKIPFTRNVIVYMMSNYERLLMAKAATDAKNKPPPPPPPAPPCPASYVMSPPIISMPTYGLVYPAHVDGITAYLQTKCGAENVDYTKSTFQLEFEHFETGSVNDWQPFRDYKIRMSYAAQGGSVASETLPLNDTGLWRVKARQLIVQKHSSQPTIGTYSNWINFHIGPPEYSAAQIDDSPIKHLGSSDNQYQRMERDFKTRQMKPLDQKTLRKAVQLESKKPLTTQPQIQLEKAPTPQRVPEIAPD